MADEHIKPAVRKWLKREKKAVKDDLWPWLEEKYELGMELRRPYEQKWLINLCFLAGKQYVFFNDATNILQGLTNTKFRVRVVDNKILPRFQKQVSRLIRNNPRMSVVPSSTDTEDIKAAQIGDKVLKWFWKDHKMRKNVRQIGSWIYATGNCFVDDRWNKRMGPVVVGEDGKARYAGDVDVGIWSPFEIVVPSGSLTQCEHEDLPWSMKAKYRPIEWFQHYKRGREVTPESRPIPFADASTLFGGIGSNTAAGKIDGAVWKEIRVKPCPEYPRGLFVEGANGIILEKRDYPHDSYHLEHFKDIEIPGVFWGMATTEAAIWLQKVWNRQLSDIAEFNRTMARGKWLIPRNSQMEVLPDDTHGQKLLYNPVLGHKPEMMDLKGLPATYQLALEYVAVSLMELYHQHEVTQGTNKSDIRSGEMVALLLEQDDFGNIPTHAVFEEGLESLMSRVLRRVKDGYTESRVIAITGRDLEHDVFNFTGADLRNNTDVAVAKDSSIPDSKVARQFRIREDYKEGMYGNPQDPEVRERVMKMLREVPSEEIRDLFAENYLDRQNAQVENKSMLAQPGVQFLINPYDNHAVHLKIHGMERKQPEYQKLKQENMRAFGLMESTFQLHMQQHQRAYAKQLKAEEERMARMEQLTKGGQGGRK